MIFAIFLRRPFLQKTSRRLLQEEIPEEEDQEELPTIISNSIPEQEVAATADFVNKDLADLRLNVMPTHIEDHPQSSSLETSTTVSTRIEATPVSNDFQLPILIQTSSTSDASSLSKRSRIELVIKKINGNGICNFYMLSISIIFTVGYVKEMA